LRAAGSIAAKLVGTRLRDWIRGYTQLKITRDFKLETSNGGLQTQEENSKMKKEAKRLRFNILFHSHFNLAISLRSINLTSLACLET